MFIRKQLKVIGQGGAELAQHVRLQLPNGDIIQVANVYFPPVQNMQKRGLKEEVARQQVAEVLDRLPSQHSTVICGDFNARTGNRAPRVGEQVDVRQSMDTQSCPRGAWLL